MTVLFDAPTFLYKFQFTGLLNETDMHNIKEPLEDNASRGERVC